MEYTTLASLLVLWLNFMVQVIPVRLASTYMELLMGVVMSSGGHVTDALLAVGFQKQFSTYYWMLTHGKWRWTESPKQLIRLVCRFFPRAEWNLIVDDFIIPRASKKVPYGAYWHDHGKRANRPIFIWGQQMVALGLSISYGKIWASLPLVLRLHRGTGNRSKITTAVSLIRWLAPIFRRTGTLKLRTLVDAWYMKGPFILPLLKQGIEVIGQVRKDTALFDFPGDQNTCRRGRPRKYGRRWTFQDFKEQMPLHTAYLRIYGQEPKRVTYYFKKLKARFLKGEPVIAIWSQLPDRKGWTLILSTDLELTPEQIIKLFSKRWKTEPMFNEIKHSFGVAQAWQRSGRALHRWVSILSVAYALMRLLSLVMNTQKNKKALPPIPWRKNSPATAGLARTAVRLFFRRFGFRLLWRPKYKKLILENEPISRENAIWHLQS